MMDLEDRYQFEISGEQIEQLESVGAVVDFTEQTLAGSRSNSD